MVTNRIIYGKTILITGGTGSFGNAFVSKLLTKYKPKVIRVYSRDELKQLQMKKKFKSNPRLRFFIGDVRDRARLLRAMEGCDIVVHAAALKHIAACEYNPFEAIKTNVLGAMNVIEASLDAGVSKVIALSTDKAANPANLYGATKLCAEKLFLDAASYTGKKKVKFAVVRYGNVMASRGSVIPIFQEQLQKGNKVTITDKRMTRFWITLDEATDFVLTSLAMMQGGEIFVPKIPSMKVTDLAKAINSKCVFQFIGVQPGEKLAECLITPEESREGYKVGDRFVICRRDYRFKKKNWKKLAEGFRYDSANNQDWLTIPKMRQMIKSLK